MLRGVVYRVLADATVVVHLAFVLFVVCGGLLVPRWRWVALVHLPAAVWAVWIEWSGRLCPLTPLENWLREQGGGSAYASSFIDRYLMPVLYPPSLSREIQWALGGLVLLLNAAVYIVVLGRRVRQ